MRISRRRCTESPIKRLLGRGGGLRDSAVFSFGEGEDSSEEKLNYSSSSGARRVAF